MYKLMIVDDEEAIRNGIARGIPWNEWGFQVTAVLADGEEAIREIERDAPHVVLSDIRMPKKDGVELMQYLNQNYPEIKIVILSGYNDYEYLNMSIKNQVTEYLLKPTDVDEFEELFRKMKRRLDEEQERKEEYQALKKTQLESYFNKLLRGYGLTQEELEREFLLEDALEFYVVILKPDGKTGDRETAYRLGRELMAMGEEAFSADEMETRFFLSFEDYVVGIVRGKALKIPKEQLLHCVKKLGVETKEAFGWTVSAGISDSAGDFRMIPQCYEQAKCCISQKQFTDEEGCIIFYDELLEEEFPYETVFFDAERLLALLLKFQTEEIFGEIHGVVSKFRDRKLKEYGYVNRICQELLFRISRELLKYDLSLEELMREQGKRYTDLVDAASLEEKEAFLEEILEGVCKRLEGTLAENKKKNALAYTIRDLIDREYCLNIFSLEYAAGQVHKSAAYISRIFKNEFQCNFSDYVTRKRLEYSKSLLADPAKKVYEIAEEIGWADVSNYIKVFRRYYGTSPNEYRSSLGRKEPEA
ncbi:MAG: response regulator [Eubacteriales bacterium]|nr:response regulator [Eubacteriales bacterium]